MTSSKYLAMAILGFALAISPGCGSDDSDDDSAIEDPGPGPGPVPGPEPEPQPEPEPEPVAPWAFQLTDHVGPIIQLSAVDADHAWAVAHDGVFRTQDGATWSKVSEQGGTRIQFFDSSHGWMLSLEQEVMSSSDGGATWTIRHGGPQAQYDYDWSMSFISPTTGWLAHPEGGTLLRTTDGGDSWSELELPSGSAPHIIFVDSQSGWMNMNSDILGQGHRTYRTTDGGQTWQLKLQGSFVFLAAALNSDVAWATSYLSSTMFRTTDGGSTWTEANGPGQSVQFIDATSGWAVSSTGSSWICRSTDGGATWAAQVTPEPPGGPYSYHYVDSVAFVSSTTGWAIGEAGNNYRYGMKWYIKKTTTGGQ